MTIQQAIEKATNEGFRLKKALEFNTYQDHLGDFFLDPSFWQCLGKGMGWDQKQHQYGREGYMDKRYCECIDDYPMDKWLYHWHRLIDHLAEGKSIESFFESL